MSTLLERIADHNNLYWAWHKAKNIYRPGDIWYDELEVAKFEANLSKELNRISKEILDGSYQLTAIYPIAYPKSPDEKGTRTRQTFWVAVRDQVTWLAIVNVIGGYIDSQMPFWSYGNRLYLTIFYDEDSQDRTDRRYGFYRNTTRYLFRKWTQSWPMYRQHINLTARLMTKPEKDVKDSLEQNEQDVFNNNERLEENHPMQTAYLLPGHWKDTSKDKLHWASIDLEKFYPSISQDAIKKNIRIALPEKDVTEELFLLISRMLDFRVDLKHWTKHELKKIQLKDDADIYAHLPTGLFVAGFLANTALLEIDKQIKLKLGGTRNIAHFRFVDDHVILATSFDELTKWITEYRQLLHDADIGAVVNMSKTEPKALARYLESSNNTPQKVKKLRKMAEKASALDPDFPNPLMTHTLAKVSRIARTEFNLLTPDEEKNLIADVEHLLITDFPDHELKRDTRVSFAARMLSTMIPKMAVDNSLRYQYHKEVICQEKLLKDYKRSLSKQTDQEEKQKLQASIMMVEEDLVKYKKLLEEEHEKLKRDEDQLSKRTIKLLIKAVHENHDKVRLWARLLEFFQKSGTGKPVDATSEIQKLIKGNITNKLSVTFIHSLVLQVLSTLLLDTMNIIGNPRYSRKKQKRAISFVQNVLDPDLLTYFKKRINSRSKPYEQLSLKLFQCSCGSTIYLLKARCPEALPVLPGDFCKKFGLVDWQRPEAFFKDSKIDAGIWGWWLIDKLPAPAIGKPPMLWKEICESLDPNQIIQLNLLLRYPAHIQPVLLQRLDETTDNELEQNEGVLFDILSAPETKTASYQFLAKVREKSKMLTKSVTLQQWIEWTRDKQYQMVMGDHQTMTFDPRLGEWMALRIIQQVAEAIRDAMVETFEGKSFDIDYFRRIHPNNFKLPVRWIDNHADTLTWEGLRDFFKTGKVEFRSQQDQIIDNRFVTGLTPDTDKKYQAVLNALGSLLISLLAKTTTLPDKWNPLGQQQAWLGLAKVKLQEVAVSTYTKDIISGCFSNRNIETRLFKRIGLEQNFSFQIDNDTTLDPPSFADIDDFLAYVKLALNRLQHQQISVSMHQPRQLTPVSLVQLKDNNYQQLLKEPNNNINGL